MSRGLLAWPVEREPSWPVVIAWSMSSASPARHSPTMMRSGRMCIALRSRLRIVISPSPSRFGGRDSSVMTCSWRSWSSAASSIVTMRSPFGMNEDRTLSVVVLPEPVPPDTKTLSRASMQTRTKSNISGVAVPKPDQVVHRVRRRRELADGDDGADERERLDDRVDARAVGEARVDARARLVDPAAHRRDDPVDDAQDVLVVEERRVDAQDLAAALDVDVVGAVDHHLGDGLVVEERLDRAEARDVVDQLLDQPLALQRG